VPPPSVSGGWALAGGPGGQIGPQLTRIIADTHRHQRWLGQPLNGQMGAASQLLNPPHTFTQQRPSGSGYPTKELALSDGGVVLGYGSALVTRS
jgi:hypothetical protein